MKKLLFICFTLFSLLYITAQTETIEIHDSISGGNLKLEISNKINNLLTEKSNVCIKTRYTKPSRKTNQNTTSKPTPTKPVFKDLCAEHPKLRGIKIQVLNTKSSSEAEKARNSFSRSFPHLNSQIQYRRPNFKVLAGEYLNKKSAAKDFNQIRKKYPTAVLVVSMVWCRKAK